MNKNTSPFLVSFVLAAVMIGCASSSATRTSDGLTFAESSRFANVQLASPQLSNSLWGIRIIRLDTGAELYSRNPNSSFVPASNTKLYTTAAALDQLGPNYTFATQLLADGQVDNGVLKGNLIVRGSGDPSISGRFNDGDELATFRSWALQLSGLGISHIAGDIVGDDDAFDDLPLGYGWSWDDETYWYSAEVGALTFNDNCIDLTITATVPGQAAAISWRPANTAYVSVDNQSITVADEEDADEDYFRARASNHFVVRSKIEQNDTVNESLSVHNSTLYFVNVFRQVLIENGIEVDGYAVDIDDLEFKPDANHLSELLVHHSPPLKELTAVVNKGSHNLYAEQILRALAADEVTRDIEDADETTAERGIDKAAVTWSAAGVDTSRIQLVDGSGLSRYNLITATMTTQLLAYMWESVDDETRIAFLESLPIGGVDGTIGRRFRAPSMIGRVQAKTGTVSNVSSLSGYVTTDTGVPLAFSIMANNFTIATDSIRAVQDAIVTAFAGSKSK